MRFTSELPRWRHVRVTGYCPRAIARVGIHLLLLSFPCHASALETVARGLVVDFHPTLCTASLFSPQGGTSWVPGRYARLVTRCASTCRNRRGECCTLTYSRATPKGVKRHEIGSAGRFLVCTRRRVTKYHFAVGRGRQTSTVPFPFLLCRSLGTTAASRRPLRATSAVSLARRRPSPIREVHDRRYGVCAPVSRGGCGLSRRARRRWYASV